MSKHWLQLSTKTLLKTAYFDVFEDDVQLPNGTTGGWLRVEAHHDGVCAVCLDHQDRVLLVNQYCHPPRAEVWELPGGKIDPGEDPIAAAVREVREETGAVLEGTTRIGNFLLNNRRSARICHVVVGRVVNVVAPAPEPFEDGTVAWWHMDELVAAIRDGKIQNQNLLATWALFTAQGGR